jgi:hypothetical protein
MLPRRQLLDRQDHYRSSRIQIIRSGASSASPAGPRTLSQNGGYRVPPGRRAVTVGNEAPVPGPASQVAGGSVSPAAPAWPYAHQRYDDVIGNSPSDQHHHARLGLVTRFLPAPQLATSRGARSYRMRASQPRARLSQICVPAYQPSSRSGFLKVRGIKACYASLVRSGTQGMAALALPVRGTRFCVPAFPQVRPPFRCGTQFG